MDVERIRQLLPDDCLFALLLNNSRSPQFEEKVSPGLDCSFVAGPQHFYVSLDLIGENTDRRRGQPLEPQHCYIG